MLQFLPIQSITVESHNEYQSQSNREMNRNKNGRIEVRQAKRRDPHNTTHVVDVSCASISWVHQIEHDQKDANGKTAESPGFGARGTRNEASTAKTETTGGHVGE